jgi:hypothetical protein
MLKQNISSSHQTSRHSGSVRDERFQAKFIGWYAKFNQFSLVDANSIVVGLGGVSE